MSDIKALSVLDGRYERHVKELKEIFSEYGLIKKRVFVELSWFKFLASELKLFSLSDEKKDKIFEIFENFDENEADKIKEIEKTTNHDVKAVEYYLKNEFDKIGLSDRKEWLHFSCTSEDINNTSYALMLKEGVETIKKTIAKLLDELENYAKEYKAVPMMSRTHGQPATPTTVGKEFINFAWRIKREYKKLENFEFEAKMNGATGNYNAHKFVFPDIDWISAGEKFVGEYLKLTPLYFTTQINPYSYISELLHIFVRLSSIIIDIDRDFWGYISLGYFKQKLKAGEVGSSTMPHKVNPIDFENSEGNMGIAISLMQHLSTKLLNSRFQRDLTDSTVLRNLGALFGYFLIGLKSTLKGLGKLDINKEKIEKELFENWELLAEPIQSAMRVYGEKNPYEKLKELTRGKNIAKDEIVAFVDSLENVDEEMKKRMKELTPANYLGVAMELVDFYFDGD